jgi:hypothetical protein
MADLCYAENQYAECCYAECHVLFCIMLNVIMLGVVAPKTGGASTIKLFEAVINNVA